MTECRNANSHAHEWRTLTMRRLSQATPDPLRAHGTRYNNPGDNNPRDNDPSCR